MTAKRKRVLGPPINPAPMAPPIRAKFYDVLEVHGQQTTKTTLLSDSLAPYLTHYVPGDRRSYPCANGPECPWCEQKVGRRWTAYLMVMAGPRRDVCICAVTAACYREQAFWSERNGKLRGLGVEFWRKAGHKKSPLFAKLYDNSGEKRYMPRAPDVNAALLRLWGYDEEEEVSVETPAAIFLSEREEIAGQFGTGATG